MDDTGLITALCCSWTSSIWHFNFKGVMVIARSLKQAQKVRNLNTIVWNAIYYFQIAKKKERCFVYLARGTRETNPVVKAGTSNFTK